MFCSYTKPRYQVSVYRTIGPLVCSGRIRIMVVMATNSFHRLIIGKLKTDNFSRLNGDIWWKR